MILPCRDVICKNTGREQVAVGIVPVDQMAARKGV